MGKTVKSGNLTPFSGVRGSGPKFGALGGRPNNSLNMDARPKKCTARQLNRYIHGPTDKYKHTHEYIQTTLPTTQNPTTFNERTNERSIDRYELP